MERLLAVIGTVVVVVGLAAIVGMKLAGTSQPGAVSSATPTATSSRALAEGCTEPPTPLGTAATLTLPDQKTAAGKTFIATLTTNCGDIVFTLDGAKAPQAVASFIQLAQNDYWVNSPCHRITQTTGLKVLQCGDPTGTGTGGPGYGFAVENPPTSGAYPRGTLAMARTSDAQKGNGGQFFIVYGDSILKDPAGYTIFGTVTQGLDIVDRVAARGVATGSAAPDDGAPAAPISILRVTVTEKKA